MSDSHVSRLLARSSPSCRDVFALTLMGLLLNLVHLATKSVWLNESESVLYGCSNLTSLVPVLTSSDPNMSLYYVLLNFWMRIFGESEAAIRSLSALFGALAVAAIYLLGARLFGRTVGFVAGLLLALNAFMVQYAQTARTYALLIFLVTLSSYFLVVELERPSTRSRIGYVCASTLAMYAHYFAAYVLVVHLGTVVALRGRAALKRAWLGVAAAIALLCTPEAIIAHRRGPGAMIGWISQPSVNEVGRVFVDFAGGSQLLLFALLAGGCYATVSAIRERQYWPHLFVAAWLVVPVVLDFAVSFIQPMFINRYLIICVPALVLFGASAIARLRRPLTVAVFTAPLVLLSVTQLLAWYGRDAQENWRDATRYVLAATHPSDAIVFCPKYAHEPFEYYERQSEVSGPTKLEGRPLVLEELPPAPEGPPLVERHRIWLVIGWPQYHLKEARPIQLSLLTESYRVAARRCFRNVVVVLYVRGAQSRKML